MIGVYRDAGDPHSDCKVKIRLLQEEVNRAKSKLQAYEDRLQQDDLWRQRLASPLGVEGDTFEIMQKVEGLLDDIADRKYDVGPSFWRAVTVGSIESVRLAQMEERLCLLRRDNEALVAQAANLQVKADALDEVIEAVRFLRGYGPLPVDKVKALIQSHKDLRDRHRVLDNIRDQVSDLAVALELYDPKAVLGL